MARRDRNTPPTRSTTRRRVADLAAMLDTDLLAMIAIDLEQRIDAGGWDQPWLLYGLLPGPDRNAIDELATNVVRLDAPVPAEHRHRLAAIFQQSIALLPLIDNGDGHPVDGLDQYRAPGTAVGVVLVTEGWALPDDDLESTVAPAAHPRRVEVRIVHVLLRTGTGAAVEHRREGRTTTFPNDNWHGRVPDTLSRVLGIPVPARTAATTVLARMAALAYLGAARRNLPAGWSLPPGTTNENWRQRIPAADLRIWADVCMDDPTLSVVAELDDDTLRQRLTEPSSQGPDWANPDAVSAVTVAFNDEFIFRHARRGQLGFERTRAAWLGPGGCLDEFASMMPSTPTVIAHLADYAPGAAQLVTWILDARGWRETPSRPWAR